MGVHAREKSKEEKGNQKYEEGDSNLKQGDQREFTNK